MKFCTQVRTHGHQGRAEAGTRTWQGGSTAPSWTGSDNLVHISNTLAWINMKLSTHIDLIGPNILPPVKFYASPTGSRLLWVVWKTLAVEFEVLLLGNSFNHRQTRCAWCQDFEDAKLRTDFWYLERFGRGEEMNFHGLIRTYKVCYNLVSFTYSYKTQRVYSSPQAEQLSNLQLLAPNNRKSDILVWIWSFSLSLSLSQYGKPS